MSNAKRRHRRRYRKSRRPVLLLLPGKSPPQKIGEPIPQQVIKRMKDSYVIRMEKT